MTACASDAVLADIWVNRSWREIVAAETIACSSRTGQGAFRQRVFASVEGLPWRPLCASDAVLAGIWVNRSWRQIVGAETIACSSRTGQGAFRQRVFASVEGLPWRPTAL